MTVQTFTLANLTDLTGGGLSQTAASATFTQTAFTGYIFVTFQGAVTVTLNQTLILTGQEINIADRADFGNRVNAPITIKNSAGTGAFKIGAGGGTQSSILISIPQQCLTLFFDGTNYGVKCRGLS